MDKRTIEYYEKNADAFFMGTIFADMSVQRDKFIKYLPKGGVILDAGCGSGRDSKAFKECGFKIEAFDASVNLCKKASEILEQNVRHLTFEELDYIDYFDGIWACASLIHVYPKDLPKVIEKLAIALNDSGILYASFKKGDGESYCGERRFTNATLKEVQELFSQRFIILELTESRDVRLGREKEIWINLIARKK